jgi:hypothetical protein
MNEKNDFFFNLVERIEESFLEIDSDICADLRENDSDYAEMWQEIINVQNDFPIILTITDGEGAVTMSAEEHEAFIRYLQLKNDTENAERKQIYFRGHTDNYAYLKRINAI